MTQTSPTQQSDPMGVIEDLFGTRPSTSQLAMVGAAVALVGLVLMRSRRSDERERAAHRLVHDWREIDSVKDGREYLASTTLPLIKPVLLAILPEVEDAVIAGLRRLEKRIRKL